MITNAHQGCPSQHLSRTAELLKALGQPTRLQIVYAIGLSELSAGRIARTVGGERTNVSRHLSTLVGAGVLTVRREGTRLIYRLRTPCVLSILECVDPALCDPAVGAEPLDRRTWRVPLHTR